MSTNELGPALAQLKRNLGATPGWISMVEKHCNDLGHRWGGADTLAWWLAERTKPEPMITNRRQHPKRKPRRFKGGWSSMDVTSYLSMRRDEVGS